MKSDNKINDNFGSSRRFITSLLVTFLAITCVFLGVTFYKLYEEHSKRLAILETNVKELKERIDDLETLNQLYHDISERIQGSNYVMKSKEPALSHRIMTHKRNRRSSPDSGLQGPIGPPGQDGSDGRDGRDGTPGIPGSPGVAGIPGDRGPKGSMGDDGSRGLKGHKGIKGDPGKYGPAGAKGEACNVEPKDIASILLTSADDKHDNMLLNATSKKKIGNLFGGGAVYTRWGRTTCPEADSELVYEGIVGGSWYAHKGGSSELICLPNEPEWDKFADGFHGKSYIYGAEYEVSTYDPFEHDNAETLHDHDMPCAVCRVPTRATEIMIPAKTSCPERWNKEYSGYLMSGYYDYTFRMQYMCVDRAPEAVPGTASNQNGALLHLVEGNCGSLPCLPYVNGRELTCSVCTI